jgi:hypothetical protein
MRTGTACKEQLAIRLRHMNGGPNGCHCQPRPRFAEAEGKSNAEWWQLGLGGSVRVGFGPFGHPTRDHQVLNFPTCNSKGNVENR